MTDRPSDRQEFEAAFPQLDHRDYLAEGAACYIDPKTQGAWEGWMARGRRIAAAPEGAQEIEHLRDLCGHAYQMAGALDAPENWLDALSAAANGKPFSCDGLLPVLTPSLGGEDGARLDWLDSNYESYGFEDQHEGNRWLLEGPFRTAREAIDAARAAEGGERG